MAAAPAALTSAACVLVLLAQLLTRSEALTQPTIPFPGQGYLPEGTRLAIALNVHLERILSIGEREQNWRALHWFHLQWPDARAEQALLEATQLWADDVAKGVSPQVSSACSFACDSTGHLEAGCCDKWVSQLLLHASSMHAATGATAAWACLHAASHLCAAPLCLLQAVAPPDRAAKHAQLRDPGSPAKVEDLGAEQHSQLEHADGRGLVLAL